MVLVVTGIRGMTIHPWCIREAYSSWHHVSMEAQLSTPYTYIGTWPVAWGSCFMLAEALLVLCPPDINIVYMDSPLYGQPPRVTNTKFGQPAAVHPCGHAQLCVMHARWCSLFTCITCSHPGILVLQQAICAQGIIAMHKTTLLCTKQCCYALDIIAMH